MKIPSVRTADYARQDVARLREGGKDLTQVADRPMRRDAWLVS